MDYNEIILIESQWNLKAYSRSVYVANAADINRITVEFKNVCMEVVDDGFPILIESQWNLKFTLIRFQFILLSY